MVDSVVELRRGKAWVRLGIHKMNLTQFFNFLDCCADRDGIHRLANEEFSVGVFGGARI